MITELTTLIECLLNWRSKSFSSNYFIKDDSLKNFDTFFSFF